MKIQILSSLDLLHNQLGKKNAELAAPLLRDVQQRELGSYTPTEKSRNIPNCTKDHITADVGLKRGPG